MQHQICASYIKHQNMAKKARHVQDSYVTMTELILPNDTNTLNNLMGGRMMHYMDVVAAISAQRHSNRIVVTASVDNISFIGINKF
jgi:acyl-CoA hydrolase